MALFNCINRLFLAFYDVFDSNTYSTAAPMRTDSVAIRLRKVMQERQLNCVQLAERANVRTSFLYDILNGKSANPSAVQLAKVAGALDISLSYLAGTSKLHAQYPASGRNDIAYTAVARITLDKHTGKIISQADKQADMQFRTEWLETDLGISPTAAKYFRAVGDDMSPAFLCGDIVLIDTECTAPAPPGFFLIFDGGGLALRRIELKGNPKAWRIRILTENPRYSPDERNLGDILIVGRAVWVARTI